MLSWSCTGWRNKRGREGDRETRGWGDFLSPCLPVSLSPNIIPGITSPARWFLHRQLGLADFLGEMILLRERLLQMDQALRIRRTQHRLAIG